MANMPEMTEMTDILPAGVQQALLPDWAAGRAEEESQPGEEPQDCQDQEAQHPRSVEWFWIGN